MSDVDVVVVGAGPAGCAACITLARAGLKVWLIDRASFPREKACGDALAFSCMAALSELGVAGGVEAKQVFATDTVRFQLSDGTDTSARIRTNDAFVTLVPRVEFDQLFVDRARSYDGVRVVEGCCVEALGRVASGQVALRLRGSVNGAVHAPIVVVAAGGLSRLGVVGGRNEPRVLALRAYFDNVSGLSDAVEFITHARVLPGYFWVFPTGMRSANIGVATYASHPRLHEELAWFLAEHPRGRQLGSVRQRGRMRGGVIPVLTSAGSRVTDGVIFCGDAGRFCDPLTFHGIGPAIWSGVMAGQVASRALREGRSDAGFLAAYDGLWRARFGINALFVGMSLFDGVSPLNALGEFAPESSSSAVQMRGDAGARYDYLLRAFAKID